MMAVRFGAGGVVSAGADFNFALLAFFTAIVLAIALQNWWLRRRAEGKPLFVLHDPENLRLEAQVREGLIDRIKIGSPVEIELTTRGKSVRGEVDEVVPSADPVSRSFLVKAALPKTEGLYPGMFGKLRIRLGERPTLLVPEEAIAHVGQLTTVIALSDKRWSRRYVTVGVLIDDRREILSGLSSGETVGWSREALDGR